MFEKYEINILHFVMSTLTTLKLVQSIATKPLIFISFFNYSITHLWLLYFFPFGVSIAVNWIQIYILRELSSILGTHLYFNLNIRYKFSSFPIILYKNNSYELIDMLLMMKTTYRNSTGRFTKGYVYQIYTYQKQFWKGIKFII